MTRVIFFTAACFIVFLALLTPSKTLAETRLQLPQASTTTLFQGKTQVSVAELLIALEAELPAIAKSPAVRRDYQALITQHHLTDSEMLYNDYVRVRTAFEATRAGGLWGIAWTITDKEPQSDLIWSQWQSRPYRKNSPTTALAECDELSALVAFVAKRIGLSQKSQIGLLWPTSNHTVAVWIIQQPKPVRIMLPTSQIFLDEKQSLGSTAFDSWKQKNIYDYRREDIALKQTIPAELARYFIAQVKQHGGLSQVELQQRRNQREQSQRGR